MMSDCGKLIGLGDGEHKGRHYSLFYILATLKMIGFFNDFQRYLWLHKRSNSDGSQAYCHFGHKRTDRR